MKAYEAELLAPAGKWDVLEKVAEAGADAVYLGGKRFNMRMLRNEFNFADEELRDAVQYLHQRKKKLYITLNNLYYDYEVDELKDYLLFLQEIEADALIIQDTAIIKLHHELELDIALHASVQMGISSLEAVKFLEKQGFARVILSKNLSLEEINRIHQESPLGIEYFAHGDLCISHAGQCYMSSFIAGESGNRGRCVKPCRWKYRLEADFLDKEDENYEYFLAHNDLCLYPHLPDLLDAGVSSLKIEGRMRSADYLSYLISKYRKALDRLIDNPATYKMDNNEFQDLYEKRIRDYSSGNLYGRPELESIGISGEREPFFISSAFALKKLEREDYQEVKHNKPESELHLSLKVKDLKAFQEIYASGLDSIILAYENMRQNRAGWNADTIAEALALASDTKVKIKLETPRIVNLHNLIRPSKITDIKNWERLSGIIVNDFGSLTSLQELGIPIEGGYGLNVSNSPAAEFLYSNGLKRLTASQELEWKNLQEMLKSAAEIEALLHGPLCGMISDFCIARCLTQEKENVCNAPCLQGEYSLIDEIGQKYAILTDEQCRNYFFYPHDLCLFPYLPLILSAGLKYIRIDGQYYNNAILRDVIGIYQEAMQGLQEGKWEQKTNYDRLLAIFSGGLTAAPLFGKYQ